MKIFIKNDFITLGQFLKMTEYISSGGEAKIAVKTLNITVNDESENRRGRKLYKDDKVIIDGKEFLIA